MHAFEDAALAAQTAAGWETYLSRLEPHLAGEFLSEERAHESSGELHERYAARFGLDPTPGRRFVASLGFRGLTLEAGPVLRFERRHRHPVERLWRALSDTLASWHTGFPPPHR